MLGLTKIVRKRLKISRTPNQHLQINEIKFTLYLFGIVDTNFV